MFQINSSNLLYQLKNRGQLFLHSFPCYLIASETLILSAASLIVWLVCVEENQHVLWLSQAWILVLGSKILCFVFGIVSDMFFTQKVKHTLVFLKKKPPYPCFRIICFWSTKHRMLEFWNLLSWGFNTIYKFTCMFNTTQVLLMHTLVRETAS